MRVFIRNKKGRDYLYFGGYKQDIYLGNIDEAKFNEGNVERTLDLIYSKIEEHRYVMDTIILHLPTELRLKYNSKYSNIVTLSSPRYDSDK